MAQPFRAPLDAVARAVPITALQGATIVSEISGKLGRWAATHSSASIVVPGIQDVSILRGGSVWWCRGHAVPAARVVSALGSLLAALIDHTAVHRVPAGLLYVVARATDPRHLAPFADLADFHKTVERYTASRPAVALDSLVARFAVACSGLPPLDSGSTISDVRRLRRAGGVTLAQIASDTAIPISLLRELEWGVYTYWDLEHARGALDLYAERAGLDGDAVARVLEQEQALLATGTLRALPPSANLTARAPAGGPRHVPFAIAAVLMGAVLLGAPGDRTSRPHSTRAAVHHAAAAIRPVMALPASDSPGISPTRQITPVANPVPRPNRATTTFVRRRVPVSHQPRHPLLRLARAIVGNGQYTVQPFPQVKKEK